VKTYDIIFILDEKKFEDGGKAFSGDIAAHLKSLGAEVKQANDMGRRTFTYPINKSTAGFYWEFVADLSPDKVTAFEDKYRLNASVLRFKVFNYVAPSKNPLPPPPGPDYGDR